MFQVIRSIFAVRNQSVFGERKNKICTLTSAAVNPITNCRLPDADCDPGCGLLLSEFISKSQGTFYSSRFLLQSTSTASQLLLPESAIKPLDKDLQLPTAAEQDVLYKLGSHKLPVNNSWTFFGPTHNNEPFQRQALFPLASKQQTLISYYQKEKCSISYHTNRE